MNNTPPQVPTVSAPPSPSSRDLMRFENEKKSAGVALCLCWVLGMFGAHRFYMGRPHGATMLIIALVSFPLCFVIIGFAGFVVVWVWMVIDLFSVSRWSKEYNTALLTKIQSGQ